MGKNQVSSICFMLLFLLFFGMRLAAVLAEQEGCSSSCGLLRNISYPFRLKDDPAGCGRSSSYQLSCEGNKTILDIRSNRYYVTQISYENGTINVVDFGLASGNCALPARSPPYNEYGMYTSFPDPYDLDYQNIWATFMNCTKQIKNDTYRPIPCLSHHNTFVYVVFREGAYCLQVLEPSCRFLATIPTVSSPEMDSTNDVFKVLQKGFVLSWFDYYRTPFQICVEDFWSSFGITVRSFPLEILAAYGTSMSILPCIVVQYADQIHPRLPYFGFVLGILTNIVNLLRTLAMLGRFVFAPLAVYVFLAYKFWSTRASIDNVEKFLRNQRTLVPTRYSYTDIVAITNHFKEKIGQGGFGSVFKGKLLCDHLVAIKMLGNSRCDGEEFINEVSTIGRIHHVNVVQLVGFSSEGSKRALVYEYMSNGSLDKYIFSSSGTGGRRPSNFTWDKLNEIALGVARGIDYLHRGCDMQILHFDIKPQNILLDRNFTPKISDFGLAKLYPKEYGLVSMSAARGTIGYIAPELISRSFGVISDKSDVYSFGKVLLEMAGGRRNVKQSVENSSQVYYPSWIYDKLAPGEDLEIDNRIEIGDEERKLCMVGLWCIQMKSSSRPSMSEVIEMLEGDVDSLQMPPRPFFSSPQPISARQSFMDSSFTELSIISEHDEHP